MFTGLVEEVGTLQGVHRGSNSAILTIGARTVLEGTKVGDSIMTNGVCLTVTELGATYFSADVMHETLRRRRNSARTTTPSGTPSRRRRNCSGTSWRKGPSASTASA